MRPYRTRDTFPASSPRSWGGVDPFTSRPNLKNVLPHVERRRPTNQISALKRFSGPHSPHGGRMNRMPIRHILATAFLLLLPVSSSYTQWTPTNGPYGGFAGVVASGSSLFARSWGIYRSTDQGLTWKPVNTGLTTMSISGLAASGTTILATGYQGEVFRSTNEGKIWQLVGQLDAWNVSAVLAVGPDFFVGTQAGVRRTTDKGASWSNAGLALREITCLAFRSNSSDLFAGVREEGVYRSPDLGQTWFEADNGLEDSVINDLAVGGTTVYAATRSRGVYRTISRDPTRWTAMNIRMPDTTILDLELNGSTLFAATKSHGIYRTNTSGLIAVWNRSNSGFPFDEVRALGVSTAALLASSPGGVFRSSDNGVTWSLAGVGLPSPAVSVLSSNPSDPALMFAGLNTGGVYRSTNRGMDWSPAVKGLGHLFVWGIAFNPVSPDGLFAATLGGGVFRSSDAGSTWSPVVNGLTNLNVRSILHSGNTLFAGTGNFVYRSTDDGESWTRATGPSVYVRSLVRIGTIVCAGTDQGPIFRSTDNGATWTNASFIGGAKYSLLATRNTSGGMSLYAGSSLRRVYSSADSGASWKAVSPILGGTVYALAANSSHVFAGTLDGGVYVSSIGDTNWTQVNSGLPELDVYSLLIDPGPPERLLAGTLRSGVWARSVAEMTTSIDALSREVPHEFDLAQNFPNPFNPSTTIRYSLPVRTHVTLTVFTMLGEKVADLVKGPVDPGIHDVQFNAGKLASGVYLYRLQTDGFAQVRKFILLN